MRLILFILLFSASLQSQDIWVKHDGKSYLIDKKKYEDITKIVDEYNQSLGDAKTFGVKDKILDFLLKNFDKVAIMTDERKGICNFGVKKINEITDSEIFDKMFYIK